VAKAKSCKVLWNVNAVEGKSYGKNCKSFKLFSTRRYNFFVKFMRRVIERHLRFVVLRGIFQLKLCIAFAAYPVSFLSHASFVSHLAITVHAKDQFLQSEQQGMDCLIERTVRPAFHWMCFSVHFMCEASQTIIFRLLQQTPGWSSTCTGHSSGCVWHCASRSRCRAGVYRCARGATEQAHRNDWLRVSTICYLATRLVV